MPMHRNGTILNSRGFTLMELTLVAGIISVLSGLAALSVQGAIGRYDAESGIRMLHVELLRARTLAMQKNRQHFMVIKKGPPATYQLYEDTNDSGGNEPDDGDNAAWASPRTLAYASSWSGTIILDTRGVVKTDTSSLTSSIAIAFSVSSGAPEYDCLQVNAMRISLGKSNGGSCVPR